MRKSIEAILAENVKALMIHNGIVSKDGVPSQNGLTRAAKMKGLRIDQRTIGRVLNQEHATRIDTLASIAEFFGMQGWHLLVPMLDPANPPHTAMSVSEVEFYRRLEELKKMANTSLKYDVS